MGLGLSFEAWVSSPSYIVAGRLTFLVAVGLKSLFLCLTVG